MPGDSSLTFITCTHFSVTALTTADHIWGRRVRVCPLKMPHFLPSHLNCPDLYSWHTVNFPEQINVRKTRFQVKIIHAFRILVLVIKMIWSCSLMVTDSFLRAQFWHHCGLSHVTPEDPERWLQSSLFYVWWSEAQRGKSFTRTHRATKWLTGFDPGLCAMLWNFMLCSSQWRDQQWHKMRAQLAVYGVILLIFAYYPLVTRNMRTAIDI